MEYSGPYIYSLELSGAKNGRYISAKLYEGQLSNFQKPVTKNKTPKVYILKHEGKIVYVGYASQSIGTRLGQGVRNFGKKYGYKWSILDEVELYIIVFDKELKGSERGKRNDADLPFIEFAEAVEAELVYLVKEKTGFWPAFQNEIHFNNEDNEKVKIVAEEIYEKVD